MPVFKLALKFVQYTDTWQEVFYKTSDTINTALAPFDLVFASVATAFRHPSCYLAAVRCQDMSQPRVVRTISWPTPPAGAAGDTPDVTSTSAIWEIRDTTAALRRNIWLRGLNDDSVKRSSTTGQPVLAPAARTQIENYLQTLQTAGAQIKALDPITGTGAYRFFRVTNISVDASQLCTLTIDGGMTYLAGSRVILSQFDPKEWPGLNGHYLAEVPTAGGFKVGYRAAKAVGNYPISKGRVRNEVFRYLTFALSQSRFIKFGSRNTKDSGPFGGRGARSTVRLRYR